MQQRVLVRTSGNAENRAHAQIESKKVKSREL